MRSKIDGLAPQDTGNPLEVPAWYLIESIAARHNPNAKKPFCEVTFRISQGERTGFHFNEFFCPLNNDKVRQRLGCMLSRSGYPTELLRASILDDDRLVGLKLWAYLKLDSYRGVEKICIDGWEMRPEADGPGAPKESEPPAVDYGAQDRADAEAATDPMAGL